MSEFASLLEDLKTHRTRAIDAMVRGPWTDDQVVELAALQGSIAAIEAVMTEGPMRDEYDPKLFAQAPVTGLDGWPVT